MDCALDMKGFECLENARMLSFEFVGLNVSYVVKLTTWYLCILH